MDAKVQEFPTFINQRLLKVGLEHGGEPDRSDASIFSDAMPRRVVGAFQYCKCFFLQHEHHQRPLFFALYINRETKRNKSTPTTTTPTATPPTRKNNAR